MINALDIQRLKKIFIEKGQNISQIINSIIHWSNITGKPDEYPPEAHEHVEADITDLQDYALKSNVLELDNEDAFTPDADYEPATKKYVDDNAGSELLNKYDATVAPTATDDSSEGYEVGSEWVDVTNDLVYQCADATEDNAVWKCLSSVIIDDAPSDGETYGRKDGNWAMIIGGESLKNLLAVPSFNTLEPIGLTIDIDNLLTTEVSWS